MKFTHLHTHTHYSLLDGLAQIDPLLDKVKALGMNACAITDHGNMYGAVEFYKKAKARGIKPIIGCEVYVAVESRLSRRPQIDDTRYHLTLLVKNELGYRNLVKLVTKAHLEGFYYKPRVDDELLAEYGQGLVAMTGCIQGKIPRLIIAKKFEEAETAARRYMEFFGKENFFLELQHHPNLPEQEPANIGQIELARKLGLGLVATNDIHYLNADDAEAQDILMLINTGADINNPNRLTMKGEDFSMRSPEQMIKDFADFPEAIENTQKIANMCDFEFELKKTKLPRFTPPDGLTNEQHLRELCVAGLEKRYGQNQTQEVLDRFEYEFSSIKQLGFVEYFLIVQDFVNWAKNNRIVVGPGRGSAAGSLVSYLLNITELDPLKYGLIFERFLNPGRMQVSLPDIDMDFADRRRPEVIEYVSQKYGHDHVAQIITFGTMAARAVIRDVGRVLQYPYSYCDKLAKMIPFGMDLKEALKKAGDLKELVEQDEKARVLMGFAKKLEGCARHASTHACGVVISPVPLDEIVPIQHPTADDNSLVSQYEWHAIVDMGFLKMDFLGLKNLTIIEDTLSRIYLVQNQSVALKDIPMDDKETFALLRRGDTVGVFQLECLSGDTIISNTTIKKLFQLKNRKRLASVYLDEGKIHLNQIENVFESGIKDVYTVIAENGWFIKTTKNHNFLTENGWKKLEDIKVGEKVLIKTKSKHLVYNVCAKCGRQISGQKEGQSDFCHQCCAKFYKNPSKKISREKIRAAQIKYYQNGGKPWNLGITVENNVKWRETAEKISKALSGKTWAEHWGEEKAQVMKEYFSQKYSGKGNPMFGKASPHRNGGFRQDLGHYVRSNWEADFARILKLHHLDYQYEPKTFKLTRNNGQIMHYTPDFYVPKQNTFYEIKGWFHELDEEKMKLFKEQYPEVKLVLINKTKFAEFAMKYKNLVQWECPRIPTEQSCKFVKIQKIIHSGKEQTYDITMKSPGNNFIANGFVVHNSNGMQRYLKQLKPTQFEDIIAMVALYRPGPMQFIPDFIDGKNGLKTPAYLHPKLESILGPTYGIILYQEQTMKIAQELAGFSMAEADTLRMAIGKKIKDLMAASKQKFIGGCQKNGIAKKIAQEIWSWIEPSADYSFNKAHAACYAMVAYQTAYLKAHYPAEFMAALMTSEKNDVERVGYLIGECKNMGLEVLAPDINESFYGFTVIPETNKIRFGLSAIKNVGENSVGEIVSQRKTGGKFQDVFDFVKRINPKLINRKSLEALIKAGAFDNMAERNALLFNIEKLLEIGRENERSKSNGQRDLFGGLPAAQINSYSLAPAQAAAQTEKLMWEKELLGLFVTSHPLEEYKATMENKCLKITRVKESPGTRMVKIGGIIITAKKIITKTGKPMLFMGLQDLTDKIEIVVFASVLERNPDIFQENKVVYVYGRIDNRDGEIKIVADKVEEVIIAESLPDIAI